MAKINSSDIANALAAATGISKTAAKDYVDFAFGMLKDRVEKGDEVNISMLGKFKMTVTAPRKGRNPHTKEAINIPARHRIAFEMSRKLRLIYDEADGQDPDGGKES